MKLLCISDIHGHADALQRMLEVGRGLGCTSVLVAGDLCFPGPEPLRTWKMLMDVGAHCVQGITDLAVASVDPDKLEPSNDHERERIERLRACRTQLGEIIVARLARLPRTYRMATEDGGEILLVHGSPMDPTVPITHDMEDDEISALLGDDPADVVVCGASHVPFDRIVGVTRVINVGSVGQAPSGDVAYGVAIESLSSGVEVQPLLVPTVRPS